LIVSGLPPSYPLESMVIPPPQEPDVMYDQQGPFKDWPAPPNAAEFKQARADYRAGLACDNRYISERMWRQAYQDSANSELEQALRDKAEWGDCPVLAKVLKENQ